MNGDNATVSVKGKLRSVPAIEWNDRKIVITGKYLKTAKIFDDFLDSRPIYDLNSIVENIKQSTNADLFTFLGDFSRAAEDGMQDRAFDNYYFEYDSLAVIRINSYEHWYKKELKKQTRTRLKKALRLGVEVRPVPLDDELIAGIEKIFNETPIRQKTLFWHYGKSFAQIKKEISTYSNVSTFIGAHLNKELVGFAKLINCGKFGRANQILSLIKHHDKPIMNALISGLVETCVKDQIPYLVYGRWVEGTLGHFKQNNAFKKIAIPRYYVPLSFLGRVFLKTRMHKGVKTYIPDSIMAYLRSKRLAIYKFRNQR